MNKLTIALVAHDHRKPALLEWVKYNKERLEGHNLYSTGTTGSLIEETTGLLVSKFKSGPLGGDHQIGAMIAEEKLDMLIFFWDPMAPMPHDPDIKSLLRLSVVYNVPTACNRSTADFMISSPLFTDEEYKPQLVDYSHYIKRDLI